MQSMRTYGKDAGSARTGLFLSNPETGYIEVDEQQQTTGIPRSLRIPNSRDEGRGDYQEVIMVSPPIKKAGKERRGLLTLANKTILERFRVPFFVSS